jgi:hypothetical protein
MAQHSALSDDLEKQSDQGSHGSVIDMKEKTAEAEDIVDWDGPDDPENPINWTTHQKAVAIGIVSLITMLS